MQSKSSLKPASVAGIIAFLILLDQCVKLYIYNYHMDKSFNILFDFVRFEPKFNRQYSWINSLFDLGVGKAVHIIICLFALIICLLVYGYAKKMHKISRLTEFIFLFVLSGVICSLTDKLFWDGSLDYIQFRGFFTFDLKDVYLTAFELLLIAMLIFNYKNIRSLDEKQIAKDLIKYTGSLLKRNK